MIKEGITLFTIVAGITNPIPEFELDDDSMAAVTPNTRPWSSSKTQPEFPGLMGVSVWMMSGIE